MSGVTPAIDFSFQFGPVGPTGMPDHELYGEAIADAKLGHSLGYSTGWMIEHHFSDYYPTPNPLLFLSHVAAICPGLGLGTSVMVLPWYNPIRFAEDLAMLQTLAGNSELHIGIGRGTAKAEYTAFQIEMETARDRFAEYYKLVQTALEGGSFTYDGKIVKVVDPIKLRPVLARKKPNFYGAIGSVDSAEVMAELGLPPMAIAQFPDPMLQGIVEKWTAKSNACGLPTDRRRPIFAQCWIADTDAEARALAKEYLPNFFQIQVKHYQSDEDPYRWISGYEQWSKMFANLKRLCNPDNLDGYLDMNLIGTAETVERRIRQLASFGFNDVIVTNAIAGVRRELRHEMLERFAKQVIPRFERRKAPLSASAA
ncbi:LLM class flavin-dependent oxidoreductase [Ferrovibrio sp.]|uniref:LLM class flavin-dependent oxidoreductase n=1 Tax=Ferrovibrio sp. TaxID=1917215 RepID=UPI003D0D05B4